MEPDQIPGFTCRPEAAGEDAVAADHTAALRRLREDLSLRWDSAGRTLLAWLSSGPTRPDERAWVADRLPAHRLDTIISLARGHAVAWQRLADELEARHQSTPTGSDHKVRSPGGLRVGLLGPLEVSIDGRPISLTASRPRALLANMAMSAGNAVSIERLAAAVWGPRLPHNPRRSIQIYVTRLRHALGTETIRSGPGSYTLLAERDDVDALRFLRLLESAGSATEQPARRARLVAALRLWRGTPFEGVNSDWLNNVESPGLYERYLTALERRIDLDIAAGRAGELVAELGELTARFPLRESLWVRLLVVLDQCGRRAEALGSYEAVRARIADEFGVDPGSELQRVYAHLLEDGHRPCDLDPCG